MIVLDTSTLFIYTLLTAAIAAVWLPPGAHRIARAPVWSGLFAVSAVAGLYYGVVKPGGVIYLAALALACHLIRHPSVNHYLRWVLGIAVIAMVAALFLHAVPFFNNPPVFEAFTFGDRSPPYSKNWNFDKAAAGLILLAYFGDITRSGRGWIELGRRSYIVVTVTVVLTISLAWISGYIKPQLTLTPVYFLWAWANLFFTCIAEEMLFRGVVQKHLAGLRTGRVYRIGVVVFVGILFGLAHFAGGWNYVMLASVAGIGYGCAYHVTGRIEAAILTHFLVNSVHILFFTYPYAA